MKIGRDKLNFDWFPSGDFFYYIVWEYISFSVTWGYRQKHVSLKLLLILGLYQSWQINSTKKTTVCSEIRNISNPKSSCSLINLKKYINLEVKFKSLFCQIWQRSMCNIWYVLTFFRVWIEQSVLASMFMRLKWISAEWTADYEEEGRIWTSGERMKGSDVLSVKQVRDQRRTPFRFPLSAPESFQHRLISVDLSATNPTAN